MPSKSKVRKVSSDSSNSSEDDNNSAITNYNSIFNNIQNLQNEVRNLKDVILRQNLLFNNQVNDNIKQVSSRVDELKEIIVKQNDVLTGVLAEINAALKANINDQFRKPKFLNSFPFQNETDIKQFENEICENNYSDVIATIKSLLNPGGIRKNLTRIFSGQVINDHNLEGIHNKKRLLDYTKLIDTLYDAVALSTYSKDDFIADLRFAVKASKNKHFKILCAQKKGPPSS